MIVSVGEEKFQPAVNYYPKGVFLPILNAFHMIAEGNKANPNARGKNKKAA